MTDRVFATAGNWALASDGIQWILQERRWERRGGWRAISFVRSTRNILERCMREKNVPGASARLLLAGLPDTFDEWKAPEASSWPRYCTPTA
jgi:hypothetical protein